MNFEIILVTPLTHAEFAGKKSIQIVRTAVRIAVLATFEEQQTKCLFVKHPNKGLELPGGAIEPFETPQEAALRELSEEAGLHLSNNHQIKVAGFVPVVDFRGGHWLDIVLYINVQHKANIVISNEKEFDTYWLSIYESNKNSTPQLQRILQEILGLWEFAG